VGGALFAYGLRWWRSAGLAFLAVTLFITTPLVFEWDPTVKTYALSTLLLFGAYVAADTSSRRGWVAAGVLVGLAIDTRLLFATIIVVFALYAGRHFWAFAGGLLAGLVPLLLFVAVGPRRFLNDASASQTNRSQVTLADNVTQKVETVRDLVSEVHFLVLLLGALGLLLVSLFAHHRVPLALAIGLTLGVTCVIPTPTYHQYFVTLVPFLVIGTVDLVVLVAGWRASNVSIAGIALVAVVTGALVPFGVMPASTRGVVARNKFDVSAIREVSSAIDAHTHPGEPVLAFWPGFVFESHARPMPGLESDFETEAIRDTHLSERRARTYHMLTNAGIADAIRSHQTRLIALSAQVGHLGTRPWQDIIMQSGYRPIERLRFATLYEYGAE
jgi:hypothetical protein